MPKPKIPGSARDGAIDSRSTDAGGKQADEVASHAERATKKDRPSKPGEAAARDEAPGALRDETAR